MLGFETKNKSTNKLYHTKFKDIYCQFLKLKDKLHNFYF